MHDLFTKVLAKRDLSRAGDLFSVPDADIVDDITEVLSEISPIISHADYVKNNNDQSVVEICVTRVLSCIRETRSAERYCAALVDLLKTCLLWNLQPSSATKEEPPHAKIAADIISSIFLNYDKKELMKIALPIAVQFLPKGNKELSRNLASYLSLAAIDHAILLSPHTESVMESILSGNYGLLRVLSQVYEVTPEAVTPHAPLLMPLLPQCDPQERMAVFQLYLLIVQKSPEVLEECVPQLCGFLLDNDTSSITMQILLKLAQHAPHLLVDHFEQLRLAAKTNPSTATLCAQILTTAGIGSKVTAQQALDFVLQHLPTQALLQQEATRLCSAYPVLFTDKVLACVRQKNAALSSQQDVGSVPANKTSGGVTIVSLNSTSSSPSPPLKPAPVAAPIIQQAATTSSSSSSTVNATPSAAPTSAPIATSTPTPTAQHAGYTRRVKLGDSRSTGRLHPASNTHRSVTRLNVASGSVGGLHKSMTRLSNSQINQQPGGSSNGNVVVQSGATPKTPATFSNPPVTPVPPLSNNVVITGHNKHGIPVTSGGVTVTTSPSKVRPHSQGPSTLLNSSTVLMKYSTDALNQSVGSISIPPASAAAAAAAAPSQQPQNAVSVHHASPALPSASSSNGNAKSVMKLPVNGNSEVIVSGPTTNVAPRRSDNTSRTLLNANSVMDQRMSTFEPYQIMRDPVQQFCEKNFNSIKSYMDEVSQHLPPPTRCSIEVSNEFAERRTKKVAKLHFACQIRGPHCLYSKTCFTMRTRNPKTWIHMMFLDFQVRHFVKEKCVLSTRESGISNLKNIWQILKCENRSFTELVTSQFPQVKDREILVNELRHSGFLDVFEVSITDKSNPNCNELEYQWGCFLCNHPDKAVGFLNGSNQPMIEGQLKEKKGKWRLFRRWRTRYFTLSGAHLSCKGSSGGESIDVNQIRSVKVSRGARNIPKAFEIFTADQTLILKPKDGKNAEEWVQCLSIVVAHSQARDNPTAKTNSLPARSMGSSKPSF
ncbi:protein melted isoform X1 [Drosophila persimilis]|uniref:protein melted isoform X1 n=1 Tax=Drosophila persimilis TaxID=7234 RepID=UPI000F084F3D|nr:protein melted isoform X1 [Drosophila persimilis]XP_026845249.1 protein melted isoform X1 [Drosophila persimilis]XP_026845250.1 protein melted isoform X1 [Drosophila persimilis]